MGPKVKTHVLRSPGAGGHASGVRPAALVSWPTVGGVGDSRGIRELTREFPANWRRMKSGQYFSTRQISCFLASSSIAYPANRPAATDSALRAALQASIDDHLGQPYVWGACGLKSYDCSGFVSRVMLKNVILKKRTTGRGYYMVLSKVSEADRWAFGKVVFFSNRRYCGIVNSRYTFYTRRRARVRIRRASTRSCAARSVASELCRVSRRRTPRARTERRWASAVALRAIAFCVSERERWFVHRDLAVSDQHDRRELPFTSSVQAVRG